MPGQVSTRQETAELRELRRQNRLLEQENEVLRRAAAYLSQANLSSAQSQMTFPLVRDLAADADPRRGDLPGAGLLPPILLRLGQATQSVTGTWPTPT